MAVIASIDPLTRRIYLSAATVGVDFNPIDAYKEMRALRKADESLRPFDVFLRAFGNNPKGGGKFTERYVRQENGTRFVPYDTTQQLTVTGTVITDDGQEGTACFDRSSLTGGVEVDINYIPPQVEIIEIETGGTVTEVVTKYVSVEQYDLEAVDYALDVSMDDSNYYIDIETDILELIETMPLLIDADQFEQDVNYGG